ncbi:hypothetical protein [Clostridioides difficile]|nr:hypothetical protein [Clostridioides difficile]MDX5664920.1 hypothetical protein [Clostridioides difficile]
MNKKVEKPFMYNRELKLSDNIINDKLYYSNIAEFEKSELILELNKKIL